MKEFLGGRIFQKILGACLVGSGFAAPAEAGAWACGDVGDVAHAAGRRQGDGGKDDITMGDYAKEYSRLVSQLIESSHNYKSPKIEANYDDFSEQRIKPLNATIFYYFFGTNRAGKSWAQWMLSSARYPNDKFRRAYMRFFA